MRWSTVRHWTIALLVFLAVQTNTAWTATDLHFGQYHALVIGNNDYADLAKLKTAVNDAKGVAEVLERDYGFAVQLLLNATRSDVLRALSQLRGELGPNDNLLVYYAGHGVLDEYAEQGYWLPLDAERENPANWISNSDITDAMRAIRAKHVMVVADSCYSGTLVRDAAVTINSGLERDAWLKRMTRKRSRTALVSGGLEPVIDSGGGEHSVFAKAFLGALRENEDVLDGQAMFTAVKRPVALESDQTPQYSDIRRSGHDGGDFLFVRRSATRTAALTVPPKPQTSRPIQPAVGVFRRFDPGDAFRDCDKCPELIVVPAGSFTMGSTKAERRWAADQGVDTERYQLEGPSHQVEISYPFAMSKFEITQEEFAAFAYGTGFEAGACAKNAGPGPETEGDWRNPGFDQTGRHPATCISWEAAQAYVVWLSKKSGQTYRLPSESEWEYAARGGTTTICHWGGDWSNSDTCRFANVADATAVREYGLPWVHACDDREAETARWVPTGRMTLAFTMYWGMSGNGRRIAGTPVTRAHRQMVWLGRAAIAAYVWRAEVLGTSSRDSSALPAALAGYHTIEISIMDSASSGHLPLESLSSWTEAFLVVARSREKTIAGRCRHVSGLCRWIGN